MTSALHRPVDWKIYSTTFGTYGCNFMGVTKNFILSLAIVVSGSFTQAQETAQSQSVQQVRTPLRSRIVQETVNILKTARPEVGVGMSYFEKQEDGNWYQEPFPYDLDMTSISGSIGAVFKISERDFVRLGFNYLGKVQSEAIATASDENYAECKHDTSKCWPLSHWYGKGHTKQFYLTYDRYYRLLGVVVVVEGGVVMNKVDWQVEVPDWLPTRDATPIPIVAKHKAIWQPSGTLGVGVQLNDRYRVMLNVNWAPSGNDSYYSVAKGGSLTVLVIRKF